MIRLLSTKKVLLLLPLIWMGTFSEALTSTYAVTYFTVRSRALGSFLSAVVAALANYALGYFIDYKKLTLNKRAKVVFIGVYLVLQSTWWALAIWLMHKYHVADPKPVFDWESPVSMIFRKREIIEMRSRTSSNTDRASSRTFYSQGFGRAFFLYLMLQMGFNMMWVFLFQVFGIRV